MARPKGSGNKDKPFREALRLELARLGEDDPKALRGLARNLIALASHSENGLPAIKEVADRLDGKPAQAIEHSDADSVLLANRMTDDELEAIAAGGGDRAAEKAKSSQKLN